MSNKKPIFWLVALNLLLFVGFGGRYLHRRSQVNNSEEQAIISVGQDYEKLEIITQEDYREILHLADSIKQSHTISDADLDWWIDLVNRSSFSNLSVDTGNNRRLAALDVDFRYLTTATPQQKDRLFKLAKSYLSAPGQSTGKDIYFGVSLICDMKEKRAAPLLIQFLHRPSGSEVRQMSEDMLNGWNLQQTYK